MDPGSRYGSLRIRLWIHNTGVYILETPPLGEQKYQPVSFGGKNMKKVKGKRGKMSKKQEERGRERKKWESK
jgi:hypothetical protein